MSLQAFLVGMPVREFIERHYYRLPVVRPGGAAFAAPLAGPELVERLLAEPRVDAFLARDREMWEGGRAPDPATAHRLAAEGWTVVVRDAQAHEAGLAGLAAGFHRDLGAPVNVHVYATPPGRTGFGWHYDVEDVFILQARGVKDYSLRKNTVHPWPLLETMGQDLRYEREISPVWTARLGPGDALYIPHGWWHCATGVEGPSATLAVGLMAPTAMAVFDALRPELLANPAWRQRLPAAGEAGGPGAPEAYEQLFRELGRDLALALSDGAVARRFLALRRPPDRT
jgi:50S ribosomal protein L16 3-hydroxylase